MPGPLSITEIQSSPTASVICGGTPLSSHASRALSNNSLTSTTGQAVAAWPIWAVNSFSEKKSSARLVEKAVRLIRGCSWGVAAIRNPSPLVNGQYQIDVHKLLTLPLQLCGYPDPVAARGFLRFFRRGRRCCRICQADPYFV